MKFNHSDLSVPEANGSVYVCVELQTNMTIVMLNRSLHFTITTKTSGIYVCILFV